MRYVVKHLTIIEWHEQGPEMISFLMNEKKCTINDFRIFQDFDVAPTTDRNKVMHIEISDPKIAMEFKLRYT